MLSCSARFSSIKKSKVYLGFFYSQWEIEQLLKHNCSVLFKQKLQGEISHTLNPWPPLTRKKVQAGHLRCRLSINRGFSSSPGLFCSWQWSGRIILLFLFTCQLLTTAWLTRVIVLQNGSLVCLCNQSLNFGLAMASCFQDQKIWC